MDARAGLDPYDEMGEFHDLFMDETWERLRPVLIEAFGGLATDSIVVDLGAGTGVGTRVLAQSTPARIVAAEPSLTMRAVLTARVADDADLASRVTICAHGMPDVVDRIAPRLAGFVCAHVLGHVPADERLATWAALARRLHTDAIGVVVVDGDESDPGERAPVVEERRIGDHRYVARHLPGDGGAYVSEYSVLDGERVVRQRCFTGTWTPIPTADLAAELARHGFVLEPRGSGVGLVRRG